MIEFSKMLIIIDYFILIIMIVAAVIVQTVDITAVCCAWIGQVAVSSGFYFWKARSENRTKVPVNVIKSLPKSMREEIDLTQVIVTILENSADK